MSRFAKIVAALGLGCLIFGLPARAVDIKTLTQYTNTITGTDPTGVADSTSALQTYFAAVSDAYVPAGTYKVCNLALPATGFQHLHGAGLATKFIASDGCDNPVIQATCNTTAPLTVSDILIDGNKDNQTQGGNLPAHGMYINLCSSLRVRGVKFQNVAAHGLFISNPSPTSVAYKDQFITDVKFTNIGTSPSGTYGSALDVTNGLDTHIANVDCRTTAKACYRLSGVGLHLSNVSGYGYGNGCIIPVSGFSSDFTITGGNCSNGAIFSDATTTGTTSATTAVTGLSQNVISAGWQVGMSITDASGDIPANTTIAAVALGGLSITLSQAATGSHSGNTFTVNNSTFTDIIDGIRLLSTNRVAIAGMTLASNPGNGISVLNGSTDITINGNIIRNNGLSTAAVTSIGGRSGVKVFNSTTASTDVAVVGNRIFDDQGGSATQLYGVEVANSSDKVTISGNSLGPAKNNVLGLSTSGASVRVTGANVGLTSEVTNTSGSTLTGSTAETSLASFVVKANEMGRGSVMRCRGNGTLSGTVSTKTVKLYLGGTLGAGSPITVFSVSAAAVNNWAFDTMIAANNSQTAQKVTTMQQSSTATAVSSSTSNDFTSDTTIQVSGTLGNSADSIVLSAFQCERVK